MPQTTVCTRGVKYIKIARQDSGSVDNSSALQNLTDIRIQFSDITAPTQYNVTSVTEYPTYYLYSIVPTDVTSSADQEILDYYVSASLSGTTIYDYPNLQINNYKVVNQSSLNYFTASSGYWTLNNTPNIALNVTCSISFSVNPFMYALNPDPNITLIDVIYGNNIRLGSFPYSGSSPFTASWVASASITPIEGSQYIVQLNAGYAQAYYNTSNVNLIITQSVDPKSSNYDIVVMEPYVGKNFYNSDCNVIQNNVDINNIDSLYMDVDFTNSPIVAQNQAAILNGTATRAEVQPWNYSYYSNISGRYIGRQQNAIAINVYTSASQFITASAYGFTGSWPGDSTSPSIPVPGNIVIQSLDSCIYEFNWAGGGYAENSNGGFIQTGNIYLVGDTKDDVAIIKTDNPSYLDILAKMFPSGSTAYAYQYSTVSGLPTQLNITYPIMGLTDAKYYLPSNKQSFGTSQPVAGLFFPTGSGSTVGSPTLIFYGASNFNTGLWLAEGNNMGYIQQSSTGKYWLNDIIPEISGGISNGEKWFVSLYSGSGTSTSLITGLPASASGQILYQYGGHMFEISSITSSATTASLTLRTGSGIYNINQYFRSGSTQITRIPMGESGSSQIPTTGLLISKGNYPSNNLTIFGVPSPQFSGTGKGYILSPYHKKVITENIDYITKTYGNNPN